MTLRLCGLLGIWITVLASLLHLSAAFMPPYARLRTARSATFGIIVMSSPSQEQPTLTKKKSARLYSFQEARKIARGHGFESKQEFIEYDCAGAYQLPKNPDQVWNEDWTDWDDFLGTPLSFEQGREVARSLQLQREEEYLKLIESKIIKDSELASRLPYRPDLKYKQEWKGWEDWLGVSRDS